MKITIVTVVYNGVKTIASTLQSIAQQTYSNIEYIIIDGCSTDGTLDIIRKYKKHIHQLVSEPDNGIYDAMNKGICMATGDYIGFLNADDYYVNREVLQLVAAALRYSRADAVYGDLLYVNQENTDQVYRYWKAGRAARWKFLFGYMVPHPTFFVRRSVLEECGGFLTDFGLSADYEMMVRLFYKHRVSHCYVPEVLTKMRLGGAGNGALGSRLQASREDQKAWKVNGLHCFFFTTILKLIIKIPQLWIKPPKGRLREDIVFEEFKLGVSHGT